MPHRDDRPPRLGGTQALAIETQDREPIKRRNDEAQARAVGRLVANTCLTCRMSPTSCACFPRQCLKKQRPFSAMMRAVYLASLRYSLRLMVPILFDESAIAWKSNSATVNFWLENGSDSFDETQALSFTNRSLLVPK